ncbi:MAG: phytanoyl-CoA dioxygenase family protein [Granulosicoccus sp.]
MTETQQPQLKDMFDRQGFVAPVAVMSSQEASDAMHQLIRLQQRVLTQFGEAHRFKLHLLERWLFDIVVSPVIVDAVAQILGPNILCWSSDVFAKPAHTASFVSMHQDTTYAGLTPHDEIVNVWLALTPSTSLSGCLQAIPGSHRMGQLAHAETSDEANLLFFGQTAQLDGVNTQAVDMELQPGQASLHHMAVVHGSQPNRSAQPRVGLVLRYISTTVVQSKAEDSATLVRGVDNNGNFLHEPMPQTDWSDAAVNAFTKALERPSALG